MGSQGPCLTHAAPSLDHRDQLPAKDFMRKHPADTQKLRGEYPMQAQPVCGDAIEDRAPKHVQRTYMT